jgi:hypothetical protein
MNDKPMITIDGKQYTQDELSEAARSQLTNIQVADQEIARLNMQLAIAQTARNAYANALSEALPKNEQ